MKLTGSIVALITPMHQNGTIDYATLHQLIDWHLKSGTAGLVVAGSTGESMTLDPDERTALIAEVSEHVSGQVPVIASTGTSATHTTIKLTEAAKKAGADVALIVTPYYNKPPQEGLYLHYKTIAENIDIPIILYNVPGRTACDLLPETVAALSTLQNIIGIKEAVGQLERARTIREKCGPTFMLFSGEDEIAAEWMLKNLAEGVISVTANVAPFQMQKMCEAALAGNQALTSEMNESLHLLHQRLFIASNPIPTKWVLQEMGKIAGNLRSPLLPLDKKHHHAVKEAMQKAGIKTL